MKLPMVWLFALLWTTGCHNDAGFTAVNRTIEVVPFTAGMNYLETEANPVAIHLGEVGIAGSRSAFFEIRNTGLSHVRVESVEYVDGTVIGETWGDITWRHNMEDVIAKLAPINVPAQSTRLIEVPFAPQAEEQAFAKLLVRSDATNAQEIELEVRAQGAYLGRPEIEISYNGHTGPTIESDCTDAVCAMAAPLDFGNIGLGTQSTARITIRNTANCPPFPDATSCNNCTLTIAQNPDGENLGLAFKPGTNETGRFSVVDSTTLPLTVLQADVDCQSSGEQKILLTFDAPEEESEFESTLVIESNDPDKPLIEVPIRAHAKDAPLAIAEVRECGSIDPNGNIVQTDCSYSDDIAPLGRVFLDGSKSYDPAGGEIITYQWEIIEHPMDEEFTDFAWEGQNSAVGSFWVPLVGTYTVLLKVQNENGVNSGNTQEAKVTFRAKPESLLHVQLTWNDVSNDQDLHLTHISAGGHFCSSAGDCFYTNKEPHWFPEDERGKGANPRLDIDDTNGLGPENINIDEPATGSYRVFVHNYPKAGIPAAPTMNTIRIYTNGVLSFSEQRVLTEYEQVWAAADIHLTNDESEGGQATITPFPNPEPTSAVGAVEIRDASQCGSPSGWLFPGE